MRIGKTYKRVIAMMLAANLVAGFMSVTTQTKVSATQQAGSVRAENTILTTDQARATSRIQINQLYCLQF